MRRAVLISRLTTQNGLQNTRRRTRERARRAQAFRHRHARSKTCNQARPLGTAGRELRSLADDVQPASRRRGRQRHSQSFLGGSTRGRCRWLGAVRRARHGWQVGVTDVAQRVTLAHHVPPHPRSRHASAASHAIAAVAPVAVTTRCRPSYSGAGGSYRILIPEPRFVSLAWVAALTWACR